MTILLSGATGFIGRHVVRQALAAGHSVRAVVRSLKNANFDSHPNLVLIERSLLDFKKEDVGDSDAFIHLAGYGVINGMNDWEACFRVNVAESLQLWLTVAEAGVKRFVICGSCFEYGKSAERYDYIPEDAPLEPTQAYHASKAAASMSAIGFARDKNVELFILRPFHVFGEGEDSRRFWPSLCSAAVSGCDFPMTLGEQIRDFVPVEKVADSFIAACSLPVVQGVPKIYNIGSGVPKRLADFASEWWVRLGATGEIRLGVIPYRRDEVMRYVPLVSFPSLL